MAKSKTPKNQHATPSASTSSASIHPTNQANFLTSFSHYIRIDISAPSTRPDHPFELLQFLRLCSICLAKETARLLTTQKSMFESQRKAMTVVFWASLFAFSGLEAEQSASVRQHRGCFLIGLEMKAPDAEEIMSLIEGGARQLMSEPFEESVRSHRIFQDEPIEPKLVVRVVKQAELGRLVVDQAIWPQPDAMVLVVHASGFETSTNYYAPTEAQVSQSTAAPSQKKLRPASDVLHRLRWDPELNEKDYAVVYLDRFTGYQEIPVTSWKSDTSDDDFIPLHRITSFRDLRTGAIVWSRELRIDKLFGS